MDGEIVAAVHGDRLVLPGPTHGTEGPHAGAVAAARYCMAEGGLGLGDLDRIAVPWSSASHRAALPGFLRRTWRSDPRSALQVLGLGSRRLRAWRRTVAAVRDALAEPDAHLPPGWQPPTVWVDPGTALATAAYLLSGRDNAALMGFPAGGDLTGTMLAEGRYGEIIPVDQHRHPDSLELVIEAITRHLGLPDGDLVADLGLHGDAARAGLEEFVEWTRDASAERRLRLNDARFWQAHFSAERYQAGASLAPVLGPPANGNVFSERYRDLAAAAQRLLEEGAIGALDGPLRSALQFGGGRLCLAGRFSRNTRLHERLRQHPLVNDLWVLPGDEHIAPAIGAALVASHRAGDPVRPLRHPYLGPDPTAGEVDRVLAQLRLPHLTLRGPALTRQVARLLAQGEPIGWVQGRLEISAGSAGNRAVLVHPGLPGRRREVNERLERPGDWVRARLLIAAEAVPAAFGSLELTPYQPRRLPCLAAFRAALAEALGADGCCEVQAIGASEHPLLHRLLVEFGLLTARAPGGGLPALLHTSLRRPGEALVGTPAGALACFFAGGLEFLALGNQLVAKRLPGWAVEDAGAHPIRRIRTPARIDPQPGPQQVL